MYDTESVSVDKLLPNLPQPSGYRILVAVAKMAEKKGSILLPHQLLTLESTASIVGYVVSTGLDAYGDPAKFPSGPYCTAGDWVLFHSYSGTRFKVGEQEFRVLSDDQVEGVVPEPTLVERV